jgi:mRNA-degrading endonuclease RelE of RelBE toxin-antitoxin system
MAIYINKSFYDALSKLEVKYAEQVKQAIKKFNYDKNINSLNVEKVSNNFWSFRVSKEIRVIYMHENSDYVLFHVNLHDLAYDWSDRHLIEFSTQGSIEIIEFDDLSFPDKNKFETDNSIFQRKSVNIDVINRLIKNKAFIPYLLKCETVNEVIEFLNINGFSDDVRESIIDLLNGVPFLEVEKRIISGGITLNQAIKKSSRTIHSIDESINLDELFGTDFADWQVYLHPSQLDIVESSIKDNILVEGGPGTGKTVVGMHKAINIAKKLELVPDAQVLFVTFSKKLALLIQENISKLKKINNIDPENSIIAVSSVDSIIRQILNKSGFPFEPSDAKHQSEIEFRLKNPPFPLTKSKAIYVKEYEEIVLPLRIKTLEDYINLDRTGMNYDLSEEEKIHIWSFIEHLESAKKRRHVFSHEDVAIVCEDYLNSFHDDQMFRAFDAIIIDEAQDLSPTKIRILNRTLKKNGQLIVLSDEEQRIFKALSNKVTEVIKFEKKYKLLLNYRTSKSIYDFAGSEFDNEIRREYAKQMTHLIVGKLDNSLVFENDAQRDEGIYKKIKDLIEFEQFKPYEIVVIANKNDKINQISKYFNSKNLLNTILVDKVYPTKDSGVCLSSAAGIKGLEFRVVIYLDYNEDLKAASYINGLNERLKYVALTRARERLIITYKSMFSYL